MENQVTEKAVENVVEKTVEVANDLTPATSVGIKELGYVALGAAGTVVVIFAVKKSKGLISDLKNHKHKKQVVVDTSEQK